MKLKDIAVIKMGQSPKGDTYNNLNNGMPFLQGRKNFGIKSPFIDTWTTNPLKIAKKNSILMSVRAPVGDINIANQEICIGRGLCSIEMKNKNNKYLYYLLLNNIDNVLQKSTGTVFDSINKNDLENLEINVHTEKEQLKISKILYDIDLKIEVNNKINDNMSDISNEIYKRWFIDFEFPNKFGQPYKSSGGKMIDSDIGKIPEDCKIERLGKFINIYRGLSYKGKFLSNQGVPMINLGNIMPNGVFRLEKNKYYIGDFKDKVTTKVGEIVIANTDMTQNREVLGTPVIIPPIYNDEKIIFSHHIYGINNLKLPKMFVFYTLLTDKYRGIVEGGATGTTVLSLPKEIIEEYKVAIPSEESIELFDKTINEMQKRKENVIKENIVLEKLRNILLPKLMNGEINLENIEI